MLSLCAMLIASLLFAQDSVGEASGRVISSRDKQPLALAQVQLEGTSFRGVTADDGTFRIPGVPAGKYVLQASIVGYYTVQEEFAVAAGESKIFEIVLTPSNARVTETVNVVADPFDLETETSAA